MKSVAAYFLILFISGILLLLSWTLYWNLDIPLFVFLCLAQGFGARVSRRILDKNPLNRSALHGVAEWSSGNGFNLLKYLTISHYFFSGSTPPSQFSLLATIFLIHFACSNLLTVLRMGANGTVPAPNSSEQPANEYVLPGLLILIEAPLLGLFAGPSFVLPCAFAALGALLLSSGFGVHSYRRIKSEFKALVQHLKKNKTRSIVFMPDVRLYHLDQWIDVIKQFDPNVVLVAKDASQVRTMNKHFGIPVWSLARGRDFQELHAPDLKIIFYINNSGENLAPLKNRSVHHVLLLHGESDKISSANRMAGLYDNLYVAGQAAIDRYENHGLKIHGDRFSIIGRPICDQVTKKKSAEKRTILYAPTWEGNSKAADYTSVGEMGLTIAKVLTTEFRDFDLIFRPHPQTGGRDPKFTQSREQIAEIFSNAGGKVVWPRAGEPTENILSNYNDSDLLITDVSSTVSDYLFSEKPILVAGGVPSGLRGESQKDALHKLFPTLAGAYVLDATASDLANQLKLALGADPLFAERMRNANYILGDITQRFSDRFVEATEKVYSGKIERGN